MSLQSNLGRGTTWQRGLFMLLFVLLYGVADFVLKVIVLFQFGSMLLSGRTNRQLAAFSGSLAQYIFQVIVFLTYRSEARPYPFSPWPEVAEVGGTLAEFSADNGAEDGG